MLLGAGAIPANVAPVEPLGASSASVRVAYSHGSIGSKLHAFWHRLVSHIPRDRHPWHRTDGHGTHYHKQADRSRRAVA
jgi:hypothetical protein